jgi:hypothetical protein
MNVKPIWLRIVPLALIALTAAGLCIQTACSGGDSKNGGYGYGYGKN